MPKSIPSADRFWSHVDKSGECWIWTASRSRNGYGRIRWGRQLLGAHRASWILSGGVIPDGLWVLHRCDNPPCVRPDHLFIGTRADNDADAMSKGRHLLKASRGTANNKAKLDEGLVREIRQRRARGETLQAIADAYGVTNSLISQIEHRRIWRTT